MLDIGTAPRRIAGLTVFSDHADPSRFYVLAEAPEVRADPDPHISLLLFRGDQEGGLLQVESQLAPTQNQLDAVRDALALEVPGGTPILARPDWRDGSVRLAGWISATSAESDADADADADASTDTRESVDPHTQPLHPLQVSVGRPSLLGDPSSVLAARLDAEAAGMAAQALRGNALPTALIYELEFLGLGGPLGIEAEADVQAIHDRLTAEGALNVPYGRARIAKTWESFEQDKLIRIRVVDESGETESQRSEALRRIGSDLVMKMFNPMPPPEAPQILSDDSVAAIELSFRLTMRREELETTAKWSFVERRAQRIRHYAGASLVGLLRDRPASAHIVYADLAPPSREIMVRAEPELEALGVAALEVELRVGSRPEPAPDHAVVTGIREREDTEETAIEDDLVHAVTLTPAQIEMRLPVQRAATDPLSYRVRARFDPERTRAPDRQTAWLEAVGSTIVLSARRLFPPRTLTAVLGRLELDWLDHVEVVVQPPAAEEPPRSLVLSSQTRSLDAYFPAAGDGPLTVTTHYRGEEGEPTRSDPPREIPVGQDLVVLDGPFGASVKVLVVPLPLSGVLSIVTELELEHEGWRHARSVSWDLPDRQPQQVALRRLRNAPASYRHRSTLVHDDGRVEVTEWTTSDDPSLVVGADGPVTVRHTEVLLLGGVTGRGAFAVELVLQAGEASTQVLLEGDADHARIVLVQPLDPADPDPDHAPKPELLVREMLLTGELREHRFPEPGDVVVVPPFVAPTPTT